MHPFLLWGSIALLTYLADQNRATLRARHERERKRIVRLMARRRQLDAEIRSHSAQAATAAILKLIAMLKDERRAAAQTRDRLPWRSSTREKAHQLVATLTSRIDELYAQHRITSRSG